MAFIRCTLKSQIMQSAVSVALYFPSDLPTSVGNEIKGVVTLLHGYTNDCEDWMHMSAAPRYAADNGLVLVCPSCQNSFYHDMKYGNAWKTFVTEEMPALLNRMFRIPTARAQNYIAGLSMGGYGALYLCLSRPDLYAGVASFSGAVLPEWMIAKSEPEAVSPLFAPIFGKHMAVPEAAQIPFLLEQTAALPKVQQPKILLTNGLADNEPYFVKMQNDMLHDTAKTLPLASYKRMEWPGVHEWNFWDRSLVYALDFFLQNGYAAQKHAGWNTQPTIFSTED